MTDDNTERTIERATAAFWDDGHPSGGWHNVPPEIQENLRNGMRAALAAIPTDWQPIETAPKDGTRILLAKYGHVCGANGAVFSLWWACLGFWSDRWNNWNHGFEPPGLAEPSHWRYVFPPPGDGQ